MISDFKTTGKRHVYDLLNDAGMDVSDWSNCLLSSIVIDAGLSVFEVTHECVPLT